MMHVEMIIDYVTDGTDFQYFDNTGILVRCRDCKHNPTEAWFGCPMAGTKRRTEDTFCSFGERKEEE